MNTQPLAEYLSAQTPHSTVVEGADVPTYFSSVDHEYQQAQTTCALFTLPWLRRLSVRGSHRGRFVHNMSTCQIKSLDAGAGNFGLIVNSGGKVVADVIFEAHDDKLLLEWSAAPGEAAAAQLLRYRIADDVQFEPAAPTNSLSLVGPHAEALLTEVLGVAPPHTPFAWQQSSLPATQSTLNVRYNPVRLQRPCWDLTVLPEHAVTLWKLLVEAGACPGGSSAFEALRIDAGVPRIGLDMNEDNIPLESERLYDTIDWDKGCYIGQEVIAMMHYRGRPNRHLVGLLLDDNAAGAAPGTPLQNADAKQVGSLGTQIHHPILERVIGLAVVKRRAASVGTRLTLPEGGEVEIVALPFTEATTPAENAR